MWVRDNFSKERSKQDLPTAFLTRLWARGPANFKGFVDSKAILWLSGTMLGRPWAILGPSWAILGHLGAIILGHLGTILGHLGTILGHLGAFWCQNAVQEQKY